MSSETVTVKSGGGIGFLGALTLLFAAAKLFGFISWSWWWVFSPLLIGAGLGIFILLIVLAVVVMAAIYK